MVAYQVGGTLELARQAADGTWSSETVDAWGRQSGRSSLAFDSAGHPAVAWFAELRRGRYELRFSRHDGSSWTSGTVEEVTGMGRYCSLAFVDGQPWIGHEADQDADGGVDSIELKRWDPVGEVWQSELVDWRPDPSRFGWWCQLAILPDSIPSFVYDGGLSAAGRDEIRYAERTTSSSPDGVWNISVVAEGFDPSLAVDSSGTPAILYWVPDLNGCDVPMQLARQQPDGSWLSSDVAHVPSPDDLSLEFKPGTDQAAFAAEGYWEGPLYAEQVVSP